MQAFCPNLNDKNIKAEFEELKNAIGEPLAYLVWHKTRGEGLGNHPGLSDSDQFKHALNNANDDRKQAIKNLYDSIVKQTNADSTLQQSVFDIYTTLDAQRKQYLKTVEESYRTSNPKASEQDVARVVHASRIQYDKNHIDSMLKSHQDSVAALFGMTLQNGYYVAPESMSEYEKQLYEWTINSLNNETFEQYKYNNPTQYNIIHPDQQASMNVIYQALYDGNLQTLDKGLTRNYIHIFWNSKLIQSGLKVFDDGHRSIKQQEDALIDAVTSTKVSERLYNKNILDYIQQFWDELKQIATNIFANPQAGITDKNKQNLIEGITSAIAASYDLDIEESVAPLYDREVGNYNSSIQLSESDKTVFRSIKSGTKVRLKSQLHRTVQQNATIISDLKLRLELLDSRNEDNIDDVFNSIQEFLMGADIELQQTLKYINTELKTSDMSTWDVQRINYIRQDLLGYYEGLIKNVLDMFSDPKSSINKLNELRRQDPNNIDLQSVATQLRNDVVSLQELYTRDIVLPYTEKILTDFVNESDAVKDKPTFIKNMLHWLHQDTAYGDLQSGEIVFGMASRSRSPIVRIIEKMMSDVEFEKGRIVLKRGRELMNLYNKVRSTGSQISFSNFQKLFIELDSEDGKSGLPTGYWVRDRNYGRFYAEKDAFEQKLRQKYAKFGLKWKLNPYNDQIQLIFPDEDHRANDSVYNRYYDELDKWLKDHCERRYTLEYYKMKRRFLSPEALQAQSFIQRQIDLICQKAMTENGFVDESMLTQSEQSKLHSLQKEKRELSSVYIFTENESGIVVIEEKQGQDLEIAKQIRAWNKHIQGKVNYTENVDKYNHDLEYLKQKYGENSPQVKRFIYNNRMLQINPAFWDYILSKINKAEQTEEYKELKSRYMDIINHVKIHTGYTQQDLSKFGIGLNQDQSVWRELKRLEQRMAEIRIKGTRKDGEEFNYLLTPLINMPGSADQTFYHYLISKWQPHYNEHPEYQNLFEDLFTYIDKKGKRKILDAFKYLRPSTDTVGPGIPSIITTYSSQYNEIDENSEYVNPNYDKTIAASLQPKVRKAGTRRRPGTIDYTNENYQTIVNNKGYKELYDLMIKTMNQANSMIPTRAIERRYLLPQITGRGMSILGRTMFGKELFSALGYGIQDLAGMKFAEQDRDVSTNWDLPRRPDGTVVNNIPIRFVKRLEKPWLVSTDIISSLMMYYDMAVNYSLKSQNLPSLELLEEALDPKHAKPFTDEVAQKLMFQPLNKQFEKVQNLMDFRYYGKEDRNFGDTKNADNKVMQATTTMSKRFRSMASLSMLALNFTTIEVGYIDAFLSSIADSIGGKYFGKRDLMYGYRQTLFHLPIMLSNLGNPDVNDWMVCAMQYNQLSRSNSDIFDRTDQSRFSKLMHMTLMGGYTMADYCINTMILAATYNHYRLVDLPDGSGKKYMSQSDCIDIYMKYGYTEKEAIDKYESSKKTLADAYYVKDGYFTVKDEFKQYVTKQLENQVAGRLRDRTHLYNGIIPTTEKAKIQQNVWGSYVTLMRNFYVNTYWERAAVGFDYAERETLPSGAFSRYVSEQAGMVNFETGETGNALGMSFLHGLRNLVSNVYRLLIGSESNKISRDQRYALKRIMTEIGIIGLSIMLALWSLAFARRHDLDDKKPGWAIDLIEPDKKVNYDVELGPLKVNTKDSFNNTLNWIRWKVALLATRTMTERSTFYWPGTAMELVQSVSTAKSYTEDLGYMIDLFMDLLSINGHDSAESVKTGGYAGMSRGTRDIIKILGPTGIDNVVRNWHTSGIKSTLNWYSGVTPNNFILPNKSTWEEQEGIKKSKSSTNSSSKSSSRSGHRGR